MLRRVAAALLLAIAAPAAAYQALVVRIIDGDTLVVLADRQQVKVRLAEIDAPERRQAFGERSRQALAALCARQQAEVTPVATDRYGRTVARVSCAGEDAGAHQVRAGMAWVYRAYAPKGTALIRLESGARAAGVGLWSDAAPTPPWEFRHRR
jgi:endonuclease YncB( thermonuclease family)